MHVLECDRRPTPFGEALRIQIERSDGKKMGWEAVWTAFVEGYPGCWAVQAFPPPDKLLNGANKYHLFVFRSPFPADFDIQSKPPGTRDP